MRNAGWPPWRRQTGCMCWTPAPPTGPRSACVPWGRWLWKRGWSPGGLTRPATALWSWYRRTRTSVCVPIWMRCFTRAGGRRWRRPGRTGPPRRSTAIPGTSTPTAPRAPCSGLKRSTPAGDTAGPTRFTRCWSGRRAGDRGGSAQRRGCSWTTTPTPAKSRGQYLPLLELSVAEAPGGRPQHPLPGPGVPVLRPVGRLYPHTGAPPVPAHRRLGG